MIDHNNYDSPSLQLTSSKTNWQTNPPQRSGVCGLRVSHDASRYNLVAWMLSAKCPRMTLKPFSATQTQSFALTIANKLVIEPLPLDGVGGIGGRGMTIHWFWICN